MKPQGYDQMDEATKRQSDTIEQDNKYSDLVKRLFDLETRLQPVENQLKGLLVSLIDELKAERAKGNKRIVDIEKRLDELEKPTKRPYEDCEAISKQFMKKEVKPEENPISKLLNLFKRK